MVINMENNWTILNQSLLAGQKIQIMADMGVSGCEMPFTLINGTAPGKTVLITAAVHADEYPGVVASIKVAKEIKPNEVKGRIIICHCVNTSGFWARTRTVECGANLNANFPGKAEGTSGERIADFFVKNILPQVDFLVDLHSGGVMTTLTPCLFFPYATKDEVRMESLAAAHATDIPYFIASRATSGLYSYAATVMDIPVLLLERGHTGQCREDWVKSYIKDVRLLLNYLSCYPFEYTGQLCPKKTYEKTAYPEADVSGLWYPAIRENMYVKKGDLLGHIEDFWGNCIAKFHAEDNGVVFYYESSLSVTTGETLVAYGLDSHLI